MNISVAYCLILHVLIITLCSRCSVRAADSPPSWWYTRYPLLSDCTEVRKGTIVGPTRVCDPDWLLQDNQLRQLDIIIQQIQNTTTCACARNKCEQYHNEPNGYPVAVALMTKMTLAEDEGKEVKSKVSRAGDFVNNLHNRWNISKCFDDVIILISKLDNVIYTFAGNTANLKLTNNLIVEINQEQLPNIASEEEEKLFQAVETILKNYHAVFAGTYESKSPPIQPPKAEKVTDGAAVTSPHLATLLMVMGATYRLLF